VTLLILGGTEFLGRYLVHAAMSRGHQITLFNRGRTNPELFPEVEKLRGDRNGDLGALAGRRWDAVIDTCGYLSSKVRATAGLLANSVEHYTFVSSISVYRDFSRAGMDESGPLGTIQENTIEDETNDATYGARKVLCERTAEEMMPGRVLSVRAGLIVGPHAGIDRFPYWVRRVARGGEVLAPATPDLPVQLIDVRDLAEWIVHMAEERIPGIFNTIGPRHRLTFEQMLEACKVASGSDARVTWVAEEFLIKHGVAPFSELPFWLPGKEHAGFFAINCDRAFSMGLACRDLVDTARDTLNWDRQRDPANEPPKRPTVLAEGSIGLDPERERQLLDAWKG
jgi:2'-hydroxyisoflavone reductase